MNSLKPHRDKSHGSGAENIVDRMVSNEHRISSQAADSIQCALKYTWIRFLTLNELTDDNSRKVVADLQLRDLSGLRTFRTVGDHADANTSLGERS
jgi:hypothetical protein